MSWTKYSCTLQSLEILILLSRERARFSGTTHKHRELALTCDGFVSSMTSNRLPTCTVTGSDTYLELLAPLLKAQTTDMALYTSTISIFAYYLGLPYGEGPAYF